MTETEFTDVLFRREGAAGVIILNRPKALNSLTRGMVDAIAAKLTEWEEDPGVGLVILKGAGERGLCAGGDIRAIHASGLAKDGAAQAFLDHEYRVNAHIKNYRKPFVPFMDGICMGGGIGLSSHASHRVVTERSTLAMPEVGIGFVPDVGGTWLLARAPGETGTYLGLTGVSFGAADAIYAGFADVMVPSAGLEGLEKALQAGGRDIPQTLAQFAVAPEPSKLAASREEIDRVFAHDTAEEIVAAADEELAKTLRSKSPTSVKVTLEALRRARKATRLEECLAMEYRMCCRTFECHDFYEGVRAQVIDKDRNPKWLPATLEEVPAELVESHFRAM